MHHENIICLPGEPIGCEYLRFRALNGRMSTYEEFMVLLTFAILIVAILEYVNHKKIAPPLLQSKGAIFYNLIFAGNG